MKTHEEIKNGLECCIPRWVDNHWKSCSSKCPYITLSASCRGQLVYDAIAYIQQLEARIDTLTAKAVLFEDAVDAGERMKRERDAAVKQLKDVDTVDLLYCSHCKHEELCDYNLNSCDDCEKDCPCHTCVDMCNWQWRGVQEGER